MSDSTAGATFGLIVFALVILGIIGWFKNIYALVVKDDFNAPYKAEVCRILGVVIPVIGAVEGYITFDKEEKTK